MIYQVIVSDIQKYLESLPSTKIWANLTVQGIVSSLINLVLVIAFVVFLFLLLWGGIQWITSGGDKEALAKAQGKISSAIVGIIIVISAWAILSLVRNFFGLP
jgi:TRAP-type C4-dicarboxylate transport system permease small subunit